MKTINQFQLKKIQSEFPKQKITTSKDAYIFISRFYDGDIDIFESSFILMMNQSNTTIGFAKISQGGITGTVVDIRIIAKYAIESLSTSIILAHNHPSGNLNPSEADRILTDRVKKGLAILDIRLFDHLILASDSYYSFADQGEI